MPQLDFYAFENQVIYLIIFFFCFINFFSYFFLPDIFLSLRTRFFFFKQMEERNFSLHLSEQKLRFSTNFFFDLITNFNFLYKVLSNISQSIWNIFFFSYPNLNSFFLNILTFFNLFLLSFISLPFSFIFDNLFFCSNDFFSSQAKNNKLYNF